jgi:hypothetical protein
LQIIKLESVLILNQKYLDLIPPIFSYSQVLTLKPNLGATQVAEMRSIAVLGRAQEKNTRPYLKKSVKEERT